MNEPKDYNRRQDDTSLQYVAERIGFLHTDITDLKDSMKESMKEMAVAVNKLVAVEVKQDAMNQSYERIVQHLERETVKREALENRIDVLEKSQPEMERLKDWFYKGILALVAVVGMFVLKFVGLY